MEIDDPVIYAELYEYTRLLLEQGKELDAINEHLSAKSEDAILIKVVITEARKDHYKRMRNEGFRWILWGSLACLVGAVLTLFNFNTNRSIDFAMYGLTTFGICGVFWGLYKVIG